MSVLHLLDLESGVVPPSALHPETPVGKREEAGKKGGSNKLGSPRAHLGSFVGLVLGSVEGDRC